MGMIEGYYPEHPCDYLKLELELRKRRNPNYSIRAFARDLSLSPSHLSEFLSGKASLSVKKATELSQRLKLSSDQKEHWGDLISLGAKGKAKKNLAKVRVLKRIKENKSQVSLDVFKLIADWHHFALLAVLAIHPKLSTSQLAIRLGISDSKVKTALLRLKRAGLIEKTKDGLKPTSNTSFAGDSIPSEAIKESHRQILNKAIEALEIFDMKDRLNQSLFFSLPVKNLPQFKETLKKRVFETISEFSADQENLDEESVQTLTWHLFPLEVLSSPPLVPRSNQEGKNK